MFEFLKSWNPRRKLGFQRAAEIENLERNLPYKRSLQQPSAIVSNQYGKATFEIVHPSRDPVYMSVRSGYCDDSYFIVHVDADKFYLAWLKSVDPKRRRPTDCKLRMYMPDDYKYHLAEKGFSQGKENPVPVAVAGSYYLNGDYRIDFEDGITRTFYLLANRFPTFPVEVGGREDADLLCRVAGVGTPPVLLNEIFPEEQDFMEPAFSWKI